MSIASRLAGLVDIKWKLAVGGAVVALIAVGFMLIAAQVENRHLTKVNASLDARINDSKVGLVKQLAQAETNVATLKTTVERQTKDIKELGVETNRKLASASAVLAAAQANTRRVEARVAMMLAKPPKSDTLEARVRDVDSRVLEMLK